MTTPEQLEQFALSLHAQRTWTASIQETLMNLIRDPAMFYRGQIIPANDRTKALDNLFRCKPTLWDMGMESIGLQCQARLRLWYQSPTDASVRLHVEVVSGDIFNPAALNPSPFYATNALALTAAIARTWAHIIRSGVMHDLEIPDNPPYSTY